MHHLAILDALANECGWEVNLEHSVTHGCWYIELKSIEQKKVYIGFECLFLDPIEMEWSYVSVEKGLFEKGIYPNKNTSSGTHKSNGVYHRSPGIMKQLFRENDGTIWKRIVCWSKTFEEKDKETSLPTLIQLVLETFYKEEQAYKHSAITKEEE